jgi:hypothetical protein
MRFICQHTLHVQYFTAQELENNAVLRHRADAVENGYKGAIHNRNKILKHVMMVH